MVKQNVIFDSDCHLNVILFTMLYDTKNPLTPASECIFGGTIVKMLSRHIKSHTVALRQFEQILYVYVFD